MSTEHRTDCIFHTATREFRIRSCPNPCIPGFRLFWVVSQPFNKKTGKPWQATKYHKEHADCWTCANHKTEARGFFRGLIGGELPDNFRTYGGEWDGASTWHSSLAVAVLEIPIGAKRIE